MNKDVFSYLVAHPTNLSLLDLKTVEAITKQYPYCQLGHTLLAKGYHIHYAEELAFEKIRHASAHAISRNALRKLINGSFKNEISTTTHPKFDSEYLYKFFEVPVNQVANSAEEDIAEQTELISNLDMMTNSSAFEDILLDDIVQKKQLQNSIIDSFLMKDPRLIRTTKSQLEAMGKQEDLSVDSAKLGRGIVTESYAKILTMQGRRDKAIEVYEKLILKIPEKKAYFVSKIQELAQV
jgi:tetratricopeptide (TPR) repeat protein